MMTQQQIDALFGKVDLTGIDNDWPPNCNRQICMYRCTECNKLRKEKSYQGHVCSYCRKKKKSN